jgi:hypothetical protein
VRHLIVGSRIAVTRYLHQTLQVGKIPEQRERVHVSARPKTPILAGFVDLLWWDDGLGCEIVTTYVSTTY